MPTTSYVLSVGDTLSTAWHKVKGTKGSVWAALGMMILIAIGVGIIEGVTKAVTPSFLPFIKIISQIILGLLQFGILYIGIRRAFDLPFSWDMVFRTFNLPIALKVFGLYLLEALIFVPVILIFVGGVAISKSQISGAMFISFLLYVVAFAAGIYLSIRLMPSMGFILDKEANPWQALKMTFAATRGNFLPLFALFIIQMLVLMVSVFPLMGIGLIWSLPFITILFGEIYKRLAMGNAL